MKRYTCDRCGKYSTNNRINFWKHQNKTKKCGRSKGAEKTPKGAEKTPKGAEKTPKGADNLTCHFCNKKFSHRSSLRRHMKSRCKVKKQKEKEDREKDELVQQLLEENKLLKEKTQQPQTVINNITNNTTNNTHNNTLNNNTQNNTFNNNTQNNNFLQFPMSTHLFLGMVHHILMNKDEGFLDAFSLATCHRDGPLFNEIELLGLKDGMCKKKNGDFCPKSQGLRDLLQSMIDQVIEAQQLSNKRLNQLQVQFPLAESMIQDKKNENNKRYEEIKKKNSCDDKKLRLAAECTIRNGKVYEGAANDMKVMKGFNQCDRSSFEKALKDKEDHKKLEDSVESFKNKNLYFWEGSEHKCSADELYKRYTESGGVMCDITQFKKIIESKTGTRLRKDGYLYEWCFH
jgi:hypothetical protein